MNIAVSAGASSVASLRMYAGRSFGADVLFILSFCNSFSTPLVFISIMSWTCDPHNEGQCDIV